MIAAALLLSYAGMAALCLAMDRHHRQLRQHATPSWWRPLLRIGGAANLLAALALCVRHWGTSIGLVAWFGLLSAGGLALIFLLPYAPRVTAALAVAALAGAVVLGAS
ncbi:MAG: DUF3325 domain-containing protein [Solimonas sp.]